MRLLVLGGTGFVGRAVVDEALARGDEVTTLNRGHQPPAAGVAAVVGDRLATNGLAGLAGHGPWDVVVDTWSAAPSAVRDAAAALADRAGRYVYVSSRSVYADPVVAGGTEDAPVVDASPDDGGDVDYARTKRGGELAALAAFGDRAVLARAGLILGPYEDVGRLPWWLARIAQGGPVLAPGPPDLPLQYVDARDLARWLLDVEAGGAYNVVSAPGHATMDQLLTACVEATASGARLCWLEPDVILAEGVQPWTELPVWLPPGALYDFLHQGDVSRALAAGLTCRPVDETVADTWTWLRGIGGTAPQRPDRPPVGLDPAVESRLLAKAADR